MCFFVVLHSQAIFVHKQQKQTKGTINGFSFQTKTEQQDIFQQNKTHSAVIDLTSKDKTSLYTERQNVFLTLLHKIGSCLLTTVTMAMAAILDSYFCEFVRAKCKEKEQGNNKVRKAAEASATSVRL